MYLILFVIWIFSCNDKSFIESRIYGTWEGVHSGKKLIFEFRDDQTCDFVFINEEDGSMEIVSGNYEINFSKKPVMLSVRNIPQFDHPLYTIVEFVEIDVIKLADFAPRWRLRPIAFNLYTSMSLKRVKKST